MRRIAAALTSVMLLACAGAASGQTSPPPASSAAHPTEAPLRLVIDQLQRGAPDYDRMIPELADATRQQIGQIQPALTQFGKVTDVKFEMVGEHGEDVYTVTFEHAVTEWSILIGPDGKLTGLFLRPKS